MKMKFPCSSAFGSILPVLAIAACSICAPSLAHDPLRDQHDQHDQHGDVAVEHLLAASNRTDLAAVRTLILSFRETGDDRWLDHAWSLLEPAIESGSVNPETLITAAFVAQSRHEFAYALELIRKALAINNINNEAWLLLASIRLVRGESDAAAEACRRLHKVPPLILLTCKARVALAGGDQREALTRMLSVLNAVDGQHLPADLLAWSYSVVGDLAAAANERPQAVNLYRRSLALAERTQVRAALVDVLLSEAQYEEAGWALDAGAPAMPLVIRRLIVAKRLNRMGDFEPLLAKVRNEFDAWRSRGDWLHAREMTRFYLDVAERPAIARQLSLINISLQQEPEDLRLERRTRPLPL